MICSRNDGCEIKVLLLGRFFIFALLAERLICGEYIRYLTEVPTSLPYLEMGRQRWRVLIGPEAIDGRLTEHSSAVNRTPIKYRLDLQVLLHMLAMTE